MNDPQTVCGAYTGILQGDTHNDTHPQVERDGAEGKEIILVGGSPKCTANRNEPPNPHHGESHEDTSPNKQQCWLQAHQAPVRRQLRLWPQARRTCKFGNLTRSIKRNNSDMNLDIQYSYVTW